MSKIKPKIYFVGEKEVHMVGGSVGVCWNLDDDGNRDGDPYIDFVQIRERGGEIYEDEDSPVEGGMEFDWARIILGELQLALEYATQELGEPGIKIYLDDVRECPDGFVLCRTAEEAIRIIGSGRVAHISFDHDLGNGLTGYDVAVYIEGQVGFGHIPCPKWNIHSANPVGRERIQAAMMSAEKIAANWDIGLI